MTKNNIKEVVENFKKELGKGFEENGFDVHYPADEGEDYSGVVAVKNSVGYFFDFEDQDGGDAVRKLDDNSRKPIIRLVVSTFVKLPHLTINQRIVLMERISDCTGIVMKKMDGDDYCLKTSSVFLDSTQMFVIATTALAYINDANHIIFDFLKTALKKK